MLINDYAIGPGGQNLGRQIIGAASEAVSDKVISKYLRQKISNAGDVIFTRITEIPVSKFWSDIACPRLHYRANVQGKNTDIISIAIKMLLSFIIKLLFNSKISLYCVHGKLPTNSGRKMFVGNFITNCCNFCLL